MKHKPQVASGMKESNTTEASNKLLGTLVFVMALWLWLKTKSESEWVSMSKKIRWLQPGDHFNRTRKKDPVYSRFTTEPKFT